MLLMNARTILLLLVIIVMIIILIIIRRTTTYQTDLELGIINFTHTMGEALSLKSYLDICQSCSL